MHNIKGTEYDIVVCGAGIAGLTLARQILMELPQATILLIDRDRRPLPQATFKVGESTTEIGAQYFTETLQLKDYFEKRHLRKLGLRFFFQPLKPGSAFQDRPEAGISRFFPPHGYQIDRGRIEQDLRDMLEADGATLLEGANVKDIELGAKGNMHYVSAHGPDGEMHQYHCRWLIDALGRSSLIRRRLKLTKRIKGGDAAWVRIARRVNVADLVPATCTNWHDRVPEGGRYYSTNHLVGPGYWVWLIPLASDYTSVGIVTHPDFHDFKDYDTETKFRDWLRRHEPQLAQYIAADDFADFRKMPRYSFSSGQVFGKDRWACTGEASAFPDPLYSPNFELIALNNSLICRLIQDDWASCFSARKVSEYNRFLLTYGEGLGDLIRGMYHCFGAGSAASLKVLWDTLTSWSYHSYLYHQGLFLDGEKRARLRGDTGRFLFLSRRVQRLFKDWAAESQGNVSFQYINFQDLPFYSAIRQCGLEQGPDADVYQAHQKSLCFFEELAQVIFLIALADTRPDFMKRLPQPFWVNAWSIGLDAGKWSDDGLMEPRSAPRSLQPVLGPLQAMLAIPGLESVCIQ